jgi:hypothetical protein
VPRGMGKNAEEKVRGEVPNSQKEITTGASGPWKKAMNLARYMAHDAPGVPGRGSMLRGEGDLLIGV